MRERQKSVKAVWCKDCKWYYGDDSDKVCVNDKSDWCTDYPAEYCSCEYCEESD